MARCEILGPGWGHLGEKFAYLVRVGGFSEEHPDSFLTTGLKEVVDLFLKFFVMFMLYSYCAVIFLTVRASESSIVTVSVAI